MDNTQDTIELVSGITLNGTIIDFQQELIDKSTNEMRLAPIQSDMADQLQRMKSIYAKYPSQVPQEIIDAFVLNQS